MSAPRLPEGIVAVGDLKVEVTSAQSDELTKRTRFLEAIDEGLADADAGRVHTHAEVVAGIRRRRACRATR